MYKTIITLRSLCWLALLCCLPLPAAAGDVRLQENPPNQYVVVKGDTLWGIAGKFLKDPWQWPKVWKMNRAEIKNPHRIYPGDVIILDMSSGSPELRLLRETVTLEPGVRVEELEKKPIPTISLYTITPFLSQPLVIENNALNYAPAIVAHQPNRVALSAGDKIYIDRIEQDSGLFWQIYRDGRTLTDAVTHEVLGTEAYYLGEAKITHFGEPASADIVSFKDEILTGDKLVPATAESDTFFIPRAPDEKISGNIISVYGGVADAAKYSIVTIDRGSSDGLEEGHVLAIYRGGRTVPNPLAPKSDGYGKLKELNFDTKRAPDGKLEINFPPEKEAVPDPNFLYLPDERVGLLMIFRTFNRVSYGLIMQSSEPINLLDLVQTP